jgi:hypothetical protein
MFIARNMVSTRWNWPKQEQRPERERVATGTFAAASDVLGIQATLSVQH